MRKYTVTVEWTVGVPEDLTDPELREVMEEVADEQYRGANKIAGHIIHFTPEVMGWIPQEEYRSEGEWAPRELPEPVDLTEEGT